MGAKRIVELADRPMHEILVQEAIQKKEHK